MLTGSSGDRTRIDIVFYPRKLHRDRRPADLPVFFEKQDLLVRFEELLQERDIILQHFELLFLDALLEIPLLSEKADAWLIGRPKVSTDDAVVIIEPPG
jgi:hypothetical protein